MSVRVIVLPSLPSPPHGTVKFHISKERPNTFQNSSSPKKVRSNTKAGTLTTFHPEQIFVFHFMLCRELPASPHKGDVSSLIRVGHCGEAPVPAISYSVTTGWHFSNSAGRTLVGAEISESLTWHQACYILLWTTARNHLLIFTFLILCWLKKKKKKVIIWCYHFCQSWFPRSRCKGHIHPQISYFKPWFYIHKFTSRKHWYVLNKTDFACAGATAVSAALHKDDKRGRKTCSQKCKSYGHLCKFPQNKLDIFTISDFPG